RKPGTYERLYARSDRLTAGLRQRFQAAGIPAQVQGIGPVSQVWFADRPISSWRDAYYHARTESFRVFWEEMVIRDVLFHPNQFENLFVSTAHEEQHIDATLAALDDALPSLKHRLGARAEAVHGD
ncbi:MAG: hypothetical protein ACRDIE_02965, partial [Chloroflexota bacterium]